MPSISGQRHSCLFDFVHKVGLGKEMSEFKPVIVMILKGYPRISESFISNEIELLEKSGFTINIVSLCDPAEPFDHKSISRITAKPLYIPPFSIKGACPLLLANLTVAVRTPRNYGRALAALCRKWLRSRSMATVKHLLQAGYVVCHAIFPNEVSRLHAHFANSPTSVAQFAHVLTGLPFGFTAHAKDIYVQRPQALQAKLRMADVVITCTDYNRCHLERLGGVPVHRAYHGIDPLLFAYRGALHPGQNGYTLLCVADFVEKKGIDTILEAVKRLRDGGAAVVLRHVGQGPLEGAMRQCACDLGIAEAVQWLGGLSHEQLCAEYSRADAFVLGCRVAADGDRDGIPNVLAESMAVGLPVVATTTSAIPELVEDGETGLLVAPDAPDELAYALKTMLTDIAFREKVIPAARHVIEERFDFRGCFRALEEVFDHA